MKDIADLHIVNVTATGASFYIDGLGNDWNTSFYMSAGVSSSPVADGSSSIDGMGYVYPPSSGTSRTTGTAALFVTLTPNTNYFVYGAARAANGLFYAAGSASFKTLTSPRPSNFSWTYAGLHPTTNVVVLGSSKLSGYGFYLPASEWNSFTSRVNEFRVYKGLSNYSFTSAPADATNNFYAYMFNQAVTAIGAMGVSTPSTVTSGSNIYASYLNGLMSSLNSVV